MKTDAEFVKKVSQSFFVDDFCSGAQNALKGYELYKKVKLRFAEAKFNLRKWVTNDTSLMDLINREENLQADLGEMSRNPKVLGIKWDLTKDMLNLRLRHIFEEAGILNPTKRKNLKSIARIYDSCGFLQNVTITLKILFQQICLRGSGWDDKIDRDLREKWIQFTEYLKEYKDIEVLRYYFLRHVSDPVNRIYLHWFSDASELAYAASIYIKYVTTTGCVGVRFVTAKSCVVPAKKKFTVPHTELLGNYILAKLMTAVRKAVIEEIVVKDFLCWGDSMISWSWIKSMKELKVFEENRVTEIKKNVSPDRWFHCRSEENPADLISRSHCFEKDKIKPFFNEKLFDSNDIQIDNSVDGDGNLNTNCDVINTFANTMENVVNDIIDIMRYINLNKLYRITSYVLRFVFNLCHLIKKQQLVLCYHVTVDELNHAKLIWLKANQAVLKCISNFMNLKSQLNLFEDKYSLI